MPFAKSHWLATTNPPSCVTRRIEAIVDEGDFQGVTNLEAQAVVRYFLSTMGDVCLGWLYVALASGEKTTGAAADAKPLRSPVMPGTRIRPVRFLRNMR